MENKYKEGDAVKVIRTGPSTGTYVQDKIYDGVVRRVHRDHVTVCFTDPELSRFKCNLWKFSKEPLWKLHSKQNELINPCLEIELNGETTMSKEHYGNTIEIKQVTTFNGTDISEVRGDQLIAAIKRENKYLEELKEVDGMVKSTAIEAMMDTHKNNIKSLAIELDKRYESKD